MGRRERDGQESVGAETRFVLRAIEVDHLLVDAFLVGHVVTQEGLLKNRVDVLDSFEDPFTAVALLVAVAQLDGLARTSGRARGHGRPTQGARVENHVGFDGGIAAGIDNLAAADGGNSAHGAWVLLLAKKSWGRYLKGAGGAIGTRWALPRRAAPLRFAGCRNPQERSGQGPRQ